MHQHLQAATFRCHYSIPVPRFPPSDGFCPTVCGALLCRLGVMLLFFCCCSDQLIGPGLRRLLDVPFQSVPSFPWASRARWPAARTVDLQLDGTERGKKVLCHRVITAPSPPPPVAAEFVPPYCPCIPQSSDMERILLPNLVPSFSSFSSSFSMGFSSRYFSLAPFFFLHLTPRPRSHELSTCGHVDFSSFSSALSSPFDRSPSRFSFLTSASFVEPRWIISWSHHD